MNEPSIEGLLTPEEHEHALRLRVFIRKIQDAVDTANIEAARSGIKRPDGEPLRKVDLWPAALLANDLSMVLFAHEQAEKRLAIAAHEVVTA